MRVILPAQRGEWPTAAALGRGEGCLMCKLRYRSSPDLDPTRSSRLGVADRGTFARGGGEFQVREEPRWGSGSIIGRSSRAGQG